MEEYYRHAIANIVQFGDTDIFPFPPENLLFFDRSDAVVELLKELDKDVRASLAK